MHFPSATASQLSIGKVDTFGKDGESRTATMLAPDELDQLRTSALPYLWIVSDSADSNLAQSSCAYDRIVMIDDGEPNYAGNWGVDEAFTDKKISDHWPVWAEFTVD